MPRSYFLIVSNMRSGSTLLETMIGGLDGAYSDYELKWQPRIDIEHEEVWLPVTFDTKDLQKLFDLSLRCGDAQLVGSKLVLDPFSLTEEAKQHLQAIIPKDWYLIHLTRSYRDIFHSRLRGVEHLKNPSGEPIKGEHLIKGLTAGPVSDDGSVATRFVAREDCFNELLSYLENDLWISSLIKGRDNVFQIDYHDIFGRFGELVRFLGLDPSAAGAGSLTERPPLQKLPSIPPELLVDNIRDLEPLFHALEDLRFSLVLDQKVLGSFLPSWQDYQARAEIRMSEGDISGAVADYSAAIIASPPNPALHYLRGSARLKRHEHSGAIDDFKAGLAIDPGNELLTNMLSHAEATNCPSKLIDVSVNEPIDPRRIPIHLATQLWGESFVSLFLEVVLPSLATPGNLQALCGFEDVLYEIYTTKIDQTRIEQSSQFQAVKEKIGDFVTFSFIEIDPVARGQYDVLADCHRRAILAAEKRGAAIIFLMPDVILGNGAISRCIRCLSEGKRLVMAPGIRTVKEDMRRLYRKYAAEAPPSVPKLVTLAVNNLHPISHALLWRDSGKLNFYCSHLYWLCGDSSIYARCAGMLPFMVFPRKGGSGFSHQIDWDYGYRAVPDENDWYVASTSDDICLIELSDRSKFAGTETWVTPGPHAVANFMAVSGRTSAHWKLLSRGYVFKGESFDESEWVRLDAFAGDLVEQASHLLSTQQYQERAASSSDKGDLLGAVSDYSAAIKGSPPNPALHFLRGSALLSLKAYEAAILDFDEGLRLSPGNGPLLQLRQLGQDSLREKIQKARSCRLNRLASSLGTVPGRRLLAKLARRVSALLRRVGK